MSESEEQTPGGAVPDPRDAELAALRKEKEERAEQERAAEREELAALRKEKEEREAKAKRQAPAPAPKAQKVPEQRQTPAEEVKPKRRRLSWWPE